MLYNSTDILLSSDSMLDTFLRQLFVLNCNQLYREHYQSALRVRKVQSLTLHEQSDLRRLLVDRLLNYSCTVKLVRAKAIATIDKHIGTERTQNTQGHPGDDMKADGRNECNKSTSAIKLKRVQTRRNTFGALMTSQKQRSNPVKRYNGSHSDIDNENPPPFVWHGRVDDRPVHKPLLDMPLLDDPTSPHKPSANEQVSELPKMVVEDVYDNMPIFTKSDNETSIASLDCQAMNTSKDSYPNQLTDADDRLLQALDKEYTAKRILPSTCSSTSALSLPSVAATSYVNQTWIDQVLAQHKMLEERPQVHLERCNVKKLRNRLRLERLAQLKRRAAAAPKSQPKTNKTLHSESASYIAMLKQSSESNGRIVMTIKKTRLVGKQLTTATGQQDTGKRKTKFTVPLMMVREKQSKAKKMNALPKKGKPPSKITARPRAAKGATTRRQSVSSNYLGFRDEDIEIPCETELEETALKMVNFIENDNMEITTDAYCNREATTTWPPVEHAHRGCCGCVIVCQAYAHTVPPSANVPPPRTTGHHHLAATMYSMRHSSLQHPFDMSTAKRGADVATPYSEAMPLDLSVRTLHPATPVLVQQKPSDTSATKRLDDARFESLSNDVDEELSIDTSSLDSQIPTATIDLIEKNCEISGRVNRMETVAQSHLPSPKEVDEQESDCDDVISIYAHSNGSMSPLFEEPSTLVSCERNNRPIQLRDFNLLKPPVATAPPPPPKPQPQPQPIPSLMSVSIDFRAGSTNFKIPKRNHEITDSCNLSLVEQLRAHNVIVPQVLLTSDARKRQMPDLNVPPSAITFQQFRAMPSPPGQLNATYPCIQFGAQQPLSTIEQDSLQPPLPPHQINNVSTSLPPPPKQTSAGLSLHTQKRLITATFGRPCFKFLQNVCPHTGNCVYSHKALPEPEILRSKLFSWPQEVVIRAYTDFVTRWKVTFALYFTIFCDFFAERRMIEQLVSMVYFCVRHTENELLVNMKRIAGALQRCGCARSDAIAKIMQTMELSRLTVTAVLDAYVELCTDDYDCIVANLVFLKQWAETSSYAFPSPAIGRLIDAALSLKNANVILLVLALLDRVPAERTVNILPKIKEFTLLLQECKLYGDTM